jgi:hypothetical protein
MHTNSYTGARLKALMIYASMCNNLNILRYDVLFILRLINMMIYSYS